MKSKDKRKSKIRKNNFTFEKSKKPKPATLFDAHWLLSFLIRNIFVTLVIVLFVVSFGVYFNYFLSTFQPKVLTSAQQQIVIFNIQPNCTINFQSSNVSQVTFGSFYEISSNSNSVNYTIPYGLWSYNACQINIEDSEFPTRSYKFYCDMECNFTSVNNASSPANLLSLQIESLITSVLFQNINFSLLFLSSQTGSLFINNSTIISGLFLISNTTARFIMNNQFDFQVQQLKSNCYVSSAKNVTPNNYYAHVFCGKEYLCNATLNINPNVNISATEFNRWNNLTNQMTNYTESVYNLGEVDRSYSMFKYFSDYDNQKFPILIYAIDSQILITADAYYSTAPPDSFLNLREYINENVWNLNITYAEATATYPTDYERRKIVNNTVTAAVANNRNDVVDNFVTNLVNNFLLYSRQNIFLSIRVIPFNITVMFVNIDDGTIYVDRTDFLKKVFNSNLENIVVDYPILPSSYNINNEYSNILEISMKIKNMLSQQNSNKNYEIVVNIQNSQFLNYLNKYAPPIDSEYESPQNQLNNFYQMNFLGNVYYEFWPAVKFYTEVDYYFTASVAILITLILFGYLLGAYIKGVETVMKYSNQIKMNFKEKNNLEVLKTFDDLFGNTFGRKLKIIFLTNYHQLLICSYYYLFERNEDSVLNFCEVFFQKIKLKPNEKYNPKELKAIPFEIVQKIYDKFCFLNDLTITHLDKNTKDSQFEKYNHKMIQTDHLDIWVEDITVLDELEISELQENHSNCADSFDMFYKYICRMYPKRNTRYEDMLYSYSKFCEVNNLYELSFSQDYLSAKYNLKFHQKQKLLVDPFSTIGEGVPHYYAVKTAFSKIITPKLNSYIHTIHYKKEPSLKTFFFRSIFDLLVDLIAFPTIGLNLVGMIFISENFFNNMMGLYFRMYPYFINSLYLPLSINGLIFLIYFVRMFLPQDYFDRPVLCNNFFEGFFYFFTWLSIYLQKGLLLYYVVYQLVLIVKAWIVVEYNILANDTFSLLIFIMIILFFLILNIHYSKIKKFKKELAIKMRERAMQSTDVEMVSKWESMPVKEKENHWARELEEFFNLFHILKKIIKYRARIKNRQFKSVLNHIFKNMGLEFPHHILSLSVNLYGRCGPNSDSNTFLGTFICSIIKSRLDPKMIEEIPEFESFWKAFKKIFKHLVAFEIRDGSISKKEFFEIIAKNIKWSNLENNANELTKLFECFFNYSEDHLTKCRIENFTKLEKLCIDFLKFFRNFLKLQNDSTPVVFAKNVLFIKNKIKINRIFVNKLYGISNYELFHRLIEFKLNYFGSTPYWLDKNEDKITNMLCEWINQETKISSKLVSVETINNVNNISTLQPDLTESSIHVLRNVKDNKKLETEIYYFMLFMHFMRFKKYQNFVTFYYEHIKKNWFIQFVCKNLKMEFNEFLGMNFSINKIRSQYNLHFVEFLCKKHKFMENKDFCVFIYHLLNYEDQAQVAYLREFFPPLILKLFNYFVDAKARFSEWDLLVLSLQLQPKTLKGRDDFRKMIMTKQIETLLDFKGLADQFITINSTWLFMELVTDSVNPKRDKNSLYNSILKAFVKFFQEKKFLVFFKEFFTIFVDLERKNNSYYYVKNQFKTFEYIFGNKGEDFQIFEILFTENALLNSEYLAEFVRKHNLGHWMNKRTLLNINELSKSFEIDIKYMEKSMKSLDDYINDFESSTFDLPSQLVHHFLRTSITGNAYFSYKEADQYIENGFSIFWVNSLQEEYSNPDSHLEDLKKEPVPEVVNSHSTDNNNEKDEYEELMERREPEKEKKNLKNNRSELILKKKRTTKIFEFLYNLMKSTLTHNPFYLMHFFQKFNPNNLLISYLVQRLFRVVNKEKQNSDVYLFSQMKNLTKGQLGLLNLHFLLEHESFEIRTEVDKVLKFGGIEAAFIEVILLLTQKKNTLENILMYLRSTLKLKIGKTNSSYSIEKYKKWMDSERVDLMFISNLRILDYEAFTKEKDFLYYLMKIKHFKFQLFNKRTEIHKTRINEFLANKDVKLMFEHLNIDDTEFQVILKITWHIFEDADLEYFLQLIKQDGVNKSLLKNYAYIKRETSYNKSNSYWKSVMSNSQLFIQKKFNPFICWLYILAAKSNYYDFYRLLKSKIKLFYESKEIKNFVYLLLYVLSPNDHVEASVPTAVDSIKYINTKKFYYQKLKGWIVFRYFERESQLEISKPILTNEEKDMNEITEEKGIHKDSSTHFKNSAENKEEQQSRYYRLNEIITSLLMYNLQEFYRGVGGNLFIDFSKLILRKFLLFTFKTIYKYEISELISLELKQLFKSESNAVKTQFINHINSQMCWNIFDPGFLEYLSTTLKIGDPKKLDCLNYLSFNRHLIFTFMVKLDKGKKNPTLMEHFQGILKDTEFCCWSHSLSDLKKECIEKLFLEQRNYDIFNEKLFSFFFHLSQDIEYPIRISKERNEDIRVTQNREFYLKNFSLMFALMHFMTKKIMVRGDRQTDRITNNLLSHINTSEIDQFEMKKMLFSAMDIYSLMLTGKIFSLTEKNFISKIADLLCLKVSSELKIGSQNEKSALQQLKSLFMLKKPTHYNYFSKLLGVFKCNLLFKDEVMIQREYRAFDNIMLNFDSPVQNVSSNFTNFIVTQFVHESYSKNPIKSFIRNLIELQKSREVLDNLLHREVTYIFDNSPTDSDELMPVETKQLKMFCSVLNLRKSENNFEFLNLKAELLGSTQSESVNLVDFIQFMVCKYDADIFKNYLLGKNKSTEFYDIVLNDGVDISKWLEMQVERNCITLELAEKWKILFEAIKSPLYLNFEKLVKLFCKEEIKKEHLVFVKSIYHLIYKQKEEHELLSDKYGSVFTNGFVKQIELDELKSLIEVCKHILKCNFKFFWKTESKYSQIIFKYFILENVESLNIFGLIHSLLDPQSRFEESEKFFYEFISFSGYDLIEMNLDECRNLLLYLKNLLVKNFETIVSLLKSRKFKKQYVQFITFYFYTHRHKFYMIHREIQEFSDFMNNVLGFIFLQNLKLNISFKKKSMTQELDINMINNEMRVIEDAIFAIDSITIIKFKKVLMKRWNHPQLYKVTTEKERNMNPTVQIDNYPIEIKLLFYLYTGSEKFFTENTVFSKFEDDKIRNFDTLKYLLRNQNLTVTEDMITCLDALFGVYYGKSKIYLQNVLNEKAYIESNYYSCVRQGRFRQKIRFVRKLKELESIETDSDNKILLSLKFMCEVYHETDWKKRMLRVINFLVNVGLIKEEHASKIKPCLDDYHINEYIEMVGQIHILKKQTILTKEIINSCIQDLFNLLQVEKKDSDILFLILQILNNEKSYFDFMISKGPASNMAKFAEIRENYQQMVSQNLHFMTPLFLIYREVDKKMFFESKKIIEHKLSEDKFLFDNYLYGFFELMSHKNNQSFKTMKQIFTIVYGPEIQRTFKVRSVLKQIKKTQEEPIKIVSREMFCIIHAEVFKELIDQEVRHFLRKKGSDLIILILELMYTFFCFIFLLVKRFYFDTLINENFIYQNLFSVCFIFATVGLIIIRKLFIFIE